MGDFDAPCFAYEPLSMILPRLGLEFYREKFCDEELTTELLTSMDREMLCESMVDEIGMTAAEAEKLANAILGVVGDEDDDDELAIEDNVAAGSDDNDGPTMEENDEDDDDDDDGPMIEANDSTNWPPTHAPAPAPTSVGTRLAGPPSQAAKSTISGWTASYSKWDHLDPDASDEEDVDGMVAERGEYEVNISHIKVRVAPSTSAEIVDYKAKGTRWVTDATCHGWVRIRARLEKKHNGRNPKGWMLIDGKSLGLGMLLKRIR